MSRVRPRWLVLDARRSEQPRPESHPGPASDVLIGEGECVGTVARRYRQRHRRGVLAADGVHRPLRAEGFTQLPDRLPREPLSRGSGAAVCSEPEDGERLVGVDAGRPQALGVRTKTVRVEPADGVTPVVTVLDAPKLTPKAAGVWTASANGWTRPAKRSARRSSMGKTGASASNRCAAWPAAGLVSLTTTSGTNDRAATTTRTSWRSFVGPANSREDRLLETTWCSMPASSSSAVVPPASRAVTSVSWPRRASSSIACANRRTVAGRVTSNWTRTARSVTCGSPDAGPPAGSGAVPGCRRQGSLPGCPR